MPNSSNSAVPVRLLQAHEVAAALDLIFADVPAANRQAIVAQVQRDNTAQSLLNDCWGSFRANQAPALSSEPTRLVGAIWAAVQAGASVNVHGPQLVTGEPETTADELLRAATADWRKRDVRLAQALLEDASGLEALRLQRAGFAHVTDIAYLMRDLNKPLPPAPTAAPLEYEPLQDVDRQWTRLSQLVERTYQGTQDCPQLNERRSAAETLSGYRETGQFAASRWMFVRAAHQDVGALLLTDYADADQWELLYIGLTPEARGHGWGRLVTEHAQRMARSAGRARLVLAVDVANQPALLMYQQAGMIAWNSRAVLLKFLA